MTLWQWLSTPAEPKGRYAILTGILTLVVMMLSMPLWADGTILALAIAGGVSGGVAGILVKLWMERRQ
ncbi:hypothetical protein [Marivita hallyeonensis]|uniref:Uncharacterized protein n=1 Tax=Marivita hallyeonensis TaxID=996342 RepID=A0A1M5VPE9_9RHOB|nr:hypothetical protein [Marivita hallyeonensis]SHH77107.1 hypothetical protein SAMN05443551_2991 [Marivita hallyeonensis]